MACLQTHPVHGDPESSMRTADLELQRLSRDDGVHILLLPEMAFSGYCFDDVDDVRRVAETDDGRTVRWCAKHAIRLGCTVLCGYPRCVPGDEKKGTEDALFNALVAVGPDGSTLANYHKTFLYVIDKTWAREGTGFISVDIPIREDSFAPSDAAGVSGEASGDPADAPPRAFVRATLGICMDINPKEFEASWEAYELAHAAKRHGSGLVLFASAWTNAHPDDDPESATPVNELEVVTYWMRRLAPLIGTDSHFVCANRIGEEKGITFTGCSCVISLREPKVVERFGATRMGLMLAEMEVPVVGEDGERL